MLCCKLNLCLKCCRHSNWLQVTKAGCKKLQPPCQQTGIITCCHFKSWCKWTCEYTTQIERDKSSFWAADFWNTGLSPSHPCCKHNKAVCWVKDWGVGGSFLTRTSSLGLRGDWDAPWQGAAGGWHIPGSTSTTGHESARPNNVNKGTHQPPVLPAIMWAPGNCLQLWDTSDDMSCTQLLKQRETKLKARAAIQNLLTWFVFN